MVPRKYRVFAWLAPLVALNVAGIVATNAELLLVYLFFFGSLFSHAALSAVWLTLGPLRWAYRVPLALIWLAMLLVAIAFNTGVFDPDFEILIQSHVVSVWTLAAITVGVARAFGGYRLRHLDDPPLPEGGRLQFGIGPLLIVTAVIALLMAFGRIAAPVWVLNPYAAADLIAIFTTIGLCAVLSVLLTLCILSQRRPLLRVSVYVLLSGIPVLLTCSKVATAGIQRDELLLIILGTLGITFLYALAIRLNGYTLSTPART